MTTAADELLRALGAGWQIVDPLTGAVVSAPLEPCIGSGQRLAFLADGWTACPVCGRWSPVTDHELPTHDPLPPPAAPRRRGDPDTPSFGL